MAKSSVRFKIGGKRTELGKSVENLTKRMNRYAGHTGTKVTTKEIRNQVRRMIEQEGKTEETVIKTLNKIRNDRLAEVFVDRKTGQLITNVTNIPISPMENIYDAIGFKNYSFDEHPLLAQWVQDLQMEYGDDLDDVLMSHSAEIIQALNDVIWGYLEKGTTQGIETALTRLYETTFGTLSWNRKQAINEMVDMYQSGFYTGRYYDVDEYDD